MSCSPAFNTVIFAILSVRAANPAAAIPAGPCPIITILCDIIHRIFLNYLIPFELNAIEKKRLFRVLTMPFLP